MVRKLIGAVIAAGAALVLLTACSSAGGSEQPGSSASSVGTSASVAAAARQAAAKSKASVAHRKLPAKPKPVNHCAQNRDTQKVIVSVRRQHAWLCAHRKTVYDTAVTTGMAGQWTATPTGNYQIEGRDRHSVLTLSSGEQYNVQYWIPFDAPLFGFHDSSWQDFPYGSAKYKTQGSHGCIHMPLKAMAFLYRWTAQPTSVHIA